MSLWLGLMVYLEKGSEDVVWGLHLGVCAWGAGSHMLFLQLGTETRGRNDIVSSHAAVGTCRSRMRRLYPVRSPPCDEGGTVKNVGCPAVADWLNGIVRASFQVSNVRLSYELGWIIGANTRPRFLPESAGILPCLSTDTSIFPVGFCSHLLLL